MYSCSYLYPGLVIECFLCGKWLFHYITPIVDGRTDHKGFTDRARNQKLKIAKKVTRTENS